MRCDSNVTSSLAKIHGVMERILHTSCYSADGPSRCNDGITFICGTVTVLATFMSDGVRALACVRKRVMMGKHKTKTT